jgi:hypothetical protein
MIAECANFKIEEFKGVEEDIDWENSVECLQICHRDIRKI